jgi:homoserine kinase type II
MALLTRIDERAARELLSGYGLEPKTFEALEAGSVNSNFRFTTSDGRAFFARVYEEQGHAGALTELRLLQKLAARGVPVALPQAMTNGELVHEHQGKPFAVYPFVEGDILCQRRVTESACRAVGHALGAVHASPVSELGLGAGRFTFADLERRLDLVDQSGRVELVQAAARVRSLMQKYGPLRPADLPSGLIHGDLFRDNVLFQGERLAALLDFESASQGTFAYDLMVTVLAWCFGDELDPKLAGAMIRAYHGVRPLARVELDALVVEGAAACIRFATTRLTDFSLRVPEGATPKRSYKRFLQRLEALESGVLTPILTTLYPTAG